MTAPRRRTVTFDVYSALIDSHDGGTAAFAELGRRYRWPVDPEALYVEWDTRNKGLHARASGTESFRSLAVRAMSDLHAAHDLRSDPVAATGALLASIPSWPPWPDVPQGLRAVARSHRVALLSNIDDDLLAATHLGIEVTDRITSEGARAYKPHRAIYDHARALLGDDLVHVPASARDVRGALEAGVTVVRVVRPGHHVDPAGPVPDHEVGDLRDLPAVLARLSRDDAGRKA